MPDSVQNAVSVPRETLLSFRADSSGRSVYPACDVFHVKHFATFSTRGALSGCLAMLGKCFTWNTQLGLSHNENIVTIYHLYTQEIRNSRRKLQSSHYSGDRFPLSLTYPNRQYSCM